MERFGTVYTEIVPAGTFYAAEVSHKVLAPAGHLRGHLLILNSLILQAIR